jgi:hypothetical protein
MSLEEKEMVNVLVPHVIYKGDQHSHKKVTEPLENDFVFMRNAKMSTLKYDDFAFFVNLSKKKSEYKIDFQNVSFPATKYTKDQKAEFEKIYAYAKELKLLN